jgi:hypothetical protein
MQQSTCLLAALVFELQHHCVQDLAAAVLQQQHDGDAATKERSLRAGQPYSAAVLSSGIPGSRWLCRVCVHAFHRNVTVHYLVLFVL